VPPIKTNSLKFLHYYTDYMIKFSTNFSDLEVNIMRLNDDALLDKITSLKYMGIMWIELAEAEFYLRSSISDSEYASKATLCCEVSSEGAIIIEDKTEIKARITIKIAKSSIKDSASRYEDEKNYFINLKESGWENEPKTLWGTGFFVYDKLHLDLFCTAEEMTVLQPLIFQSNKNGEPIFIGCQVSHPDHLDPPIMEERSRMNSEYMENGWHQGLFCISGWTLSKKTGTLPKLA